MSILQNMTIKHKLVTIAMLTTVATLSLAVGAYVIWEWIDIREDMVAKLSSHAAVMAESCKAALAFEDADYAQKMLSALSAESSIAYACVCTKEDRVLATYRRDLADDSPHAIATDEAGVSFGRNALNVTSDIVLDGEKTGTILIRADLSELFDELIRHLQITGIILAPLFLITYVLSSRLQKIISKPILDLANTAEVVSKGKDYSVRAYQHGNDEVGSLTKAFNTMLEQIQQRDSQLTEVNENLEAKVEERTDELIEANRNWQESFHSINDGITIHDKDFNILRANKAAEQILNLSQDQMVGHKCYEVYHGRNSALGGCPGCKVLANGESCGLETFKPHLNKLIEVKGMPRFDENGEIVGMVHVIQDITERRQREKELQKVQKDLVQASHRAGMAEVATDVLHNVGNILNSINVSTNYIKDKISNSKAANLGKVMAIMAEHSDDLGTFFTEDEQGKHVPTYLTEVARLIGEERSDVTEKVESLVRNIGHVKDIVKTQQSYARAGGVNVSANITDVVEDAIEVNTAGLQRHGVQIIPELDELPEICIDKQRVLQILVNLIDNGKYAVSKSENQEKLLTISCRRHGEDRLRIEVTDNGMGIAQEDLTKIFTHGFTTKLHGHGFGLHSGALAAKEMDGSLTVHSDGPGRGATFTLELPFQPREATACVQ